MAKKKTTNDQPIAEKTRTWFFPTLRKSVSAPTQEEALSLVTQEEVQEEGDGNS